MSVETCRELAAQMTSTDLTDALVVLGPDSPLRPAVRAEVVHRLRLAAETHTRKDPA